MDEKIKISRFIDSTTLDIPELARYSGELVELTVIIDCKTDSLDKEFLPRHSPGFHSYCETEDDQYSKDECSFEMT